MSCCACCGCILLARCTLRFPSTNVKITFQALHGSATDNMTVTSAAAVSSASPAKPLQPLHISIPKPSESVSVFASPCPSPTGTIRLAIVYQKSTLFQSHAFYLFLLTFLIFNSRYTGGLPRGTCATIFPV